jgi:4-amino-4-deoxyprephenate dehydrogenase
MTQNIHVIGGGGGIGRWFIEHAFTSQRIFSYDINNKQFFNLPRNAIGCLLDDTSTYDSYRQQFAEGDWVVIALPESDFEKTVTQLVEVTKPNTLFVCMSSTQVKPMRYLKQTVPGHSTFIGSHPLFGHIVKSPTSQIIAQTGYDNSIAIHRAFRRELKNKKFTIVDLSIESHDEYMATIQALSHFALEGFMDALHRPGIKSNTLMDLRTPIFNGLFGLGSRVLKQRPDTLTSIQSTPAAVAIRDHYIRVLNSLHTALTAASNEKEKAAILDTVRQKFKKSELAEGSEVAAMSVSALQSFEDTLQRYRESKAPFLFRYSITNRFRIVRILRIRHLEMECLDLAKEMGKNGNQKYAVASNKVAIENYKRIGILFKTRGKKAKWIKKRNIRLIPQAALHEFYAKQVIPVTAMISIKNRFKAPVKSLEACLPLLIFGLHKCVVTKAHTLHDGVEMLSMHLTINPSIEVETIEHDLRALIEQRTLPLKLATPNPHSTRLLSNTARQRGARNTLRKAS